MSEKYTIEQFEYRTDTIAIVENKTNAIICESTSIDDARLICRLLNEDEARKSLPKIDKDFKQQMLNHFNSLQTKDSNNWMYAQYAILIKHIESLEAE